MIYAHHMGESSFANLYRGEIFYLCSWKSRVFCLIIINLEKHGGIRNIDNNLRQSSGRFFTERNLPCLREIAQVKLLFYTFLKTFFRHLVWLFLKLEFKETGCNHID